MENYYNWVKKDHIDRAPLLCSIDLQEGKDLSGGMSLNDRISLFELLVGVGFKEIGVGQPSSSESDLKFCRTLIDEGRIPDDVTIKVTTPAQDHSFYRTFEALKGCSRAIVNVTGPVSKAGAALLKDLSEKTEGNFTYEYSLKTGPGNGVEYATDACNNILDIWKPSAEKKVVVNVCPDPEAFMPHIFATLIAYIDKHLNYRNNVILSVRPGDDGGTGLADAQLSLLAGAQRIEGKLFGSVECADCISIAALASDISSQGTDPGLDLTDIADIRPVYEKLTHTRISDRRPDADEGRISSSAEDHQNPAVKSNISYILRNSYGISIPEAMREEVSSLIAKISEDEHKVLSPQEVYDIFSEAYLDCQSHFSIPECHFRQVKNGIYAEAVIVNGDHESTVGANGNGRIDAVSNAIKEYFNVSYELSVYEEHSLSQGSSSQAMTYIAVTCDGSMFWGVGLDVDLVKASVQSLVAAVNRLFDSIEVKQIEDDRMIKMQNYIQANYRTVTLSDMAERFHLSEPYISRYIKQKSGKTFGEMVANTRMKKARTLLRNTTMTVENIAYAVGYQNVEHFDRQFKRRYNITPIEYRNSVS